ncbi:MAG: outer membrane beta-barrel protein [Variibacter sp.]|nr:outer membrane beta-barrel protein [Variibacter sp.]
MGGPRVSAWLLAAGVGALMAPLALHAQSAPPVAEELRGSARPEARVQASRPRARARKAAPQPRQQPLSILPSYGNPPGSGAGDTGFVSEPPPPAGAGAAGSRGRTGREREARDARDPTPRPPPSPGAHAGPARPGSPNTGPSRPGASLDLPAGTATPPIRRKRPPEEDPFEPTGIHAGGFILRPAFETTGGYDSNPGRFPGTKGSWFYTLSPELSLRSQWSRHALNADLKGTYSAYENTPSLNRPFLDGRVNARIDVLRTTRVDLEARTTISTNNPGSPDLPADLARLPLYTSVGGSAGITQQFNRFELGLKGSIDRVSYDNSLLTDGSVISNADRNYNQYMVQLRAAYELTPGMKPFVEAAFDARSRDLPVDAFGVHRNSEGMTARLGTSFEFSRKLTGELSVGAITRSYHDASLQSFSGLVVDGSLVWTATALTTVKFSAKSTMDESTLANVSGVLRRDFSLQVDHAFRRWLVGTARIGYARDIYEGSVRRDDRYLASVGVIYKLNREMQLKAELRREWLHSNTPGFDYTANIALVGLRLQR